MKDGYSIIIPAYNEENSIKTLLDGIFKSDTLKGVEVIVVDDNSKDRTTAFASAYPVILIKNVSNSGYGYSLKRGIIAAKHNNIIILDADSSYPVSSLDSLLKEYENGFDMVVGSRHGKYYQGSLAKRVGRFFFRRISEFTTGRRIPDINSGCRVFKKDVALKFFHTLSSGFSFTTTITLAFMLNSHSVSYIPIEYHKRVGTSKVRYSRDILRSMQIVVESIILYNPIKIFMLLALGILMSGGLGLIISFSWPIAGLITFLSLALTILVLGVGFIGVFLRYSHEQA